MIRQGDDLFEWLGENIDALTTPSEAAGVLAVAQRLSSDANKALTQLLPVFAEYRSKGEALACVLGRPARDAIISLPSGVAVSLGEFEEALREQSSSGIEVRVDEDSHIS